MQVLCRGGLWGVKCRFSVVNFVECLVWWLIWVVFAVHVDGSVRNCSAWFVLVNVRFLDRSAF